MGVLVLYSTVEGHTRKIAEAVARQFENDGHEVALTATSDPGYCDPGTFDAAILLAPIHMGNYPPDFVRYIQNWKASLNAVPNALITVSLAIASKNEDEREEAMSFPAKLAEQTGWNPLERHHAAGALKYLEYDFFKRWIMRRIAAAEGGPVDTSKDYELTDWAALSAFITGFEAHLPPPAR